MKTSNETRTAEELKQATQPSNSNPKSRKARKWLKFIEFAVVGFATWLNPNAGFLIFLLITLFSTFGAASRGARAVVIGTHRARLRARY